MRTSIKQNIIKERLNLVEMIDNGEGQGTQRIMFYTIKGRVNASCCKIT